MRKNTLAIAELFRFLFYLSKYQILPYYGRLVTKSYLALFFFHLIKYIFYPPNLFFFQGKNRNHTQDLSEFLTALGPIYIKFGQTLSTRPDIVGEEIAGILKKLQDDLSPFESTVAKEIVEKSIGSDLNQVFIEFEEVPTSSASVAQVHKARLRNTNECVAVKILRPKIREIYHQNILFIEFLFSFAKNFLVQDIKFEYDEIIKLFISTMDFELNLLNEAAAASKIADNFKDDNDLCVPKVYWQITSSNVLVTEWIDGYSIYDDEKLLISGLDRKLIAQKLATIFFNQAYRDGFFHADLHPGNILITKNGQIALVDFGIIGILADKDRLAIAEILYCFLRRDYERVAKLHLDAGYITKNTNLILFAQSCRIIAEPLIGRSTKEISAGKLLLDLINMARKYGMPPQPQLIMLQKTMLSVEGVGYSLDKDINMWQLARPWMEKWAKYNITTYAKLFSKIKEKIENYSEL